MQKCTEHHYLVLQIDVALRPHNSCHCFAISLLKCQQNPISQYLWLSKSWGAGFSIRIRVSGKTLGVGGEGIQWYLEPKEWPWSRCTRSVPHLGDSYNLDLLKCISAFWGKYMYNFNKYYHSHTIFHISFKIYYLIDFQKDAEAAI